MVNPLLPSANSYAENLNNTNNKSTAMSHRHSEREAKTNTDKSSAEQLAENIKGLFREYEKIVMSERIKNAKRTKS
ncbi:hypothetical protein B7Z00_03730 [Candidatus Saccharibacteria bacterium 32-50-10]|nr:MAG: hypothetical protein B7Z00_03730 [Candidatus Saccharibacteria bacterium 32-50-10]